MSINYNHLAKPFFVLAPMDDVTDIVFRDVVEKVSPPDLFFTEFTSVDGLDSVGRERVIEKLRRNKNSSVPIIAQIWGKDPELYAKAARDCVDLGFDGIDINMGCPEKGIVARGCCGGLIGDYDTAKAIIEAVKSNAKDLPVSVKTRIGLRTIITDEWFSFLLKQDLAAITVHGRTVKEMSKVPAHWDEIKKVVKLRDSISPKTIIIGNGDIQSRENGIQLAEYSGVDGLMIGRGIFSDIFFFEVDKLDHEPAEMIKILLDHLDRFERDDKPKKSFQALKKFFKIYVSEWSGSHELRTKLMETNTPEEVRSILDPILANKS